MNIFATYKCPVKSAQYLDDKRVVKMVLESTQMLCAAVNELAGHQVSAYKTTHKNHPCNKWVRSDIRNFMWLLKHGIALAKEYTKRYGKRHKSQDVLESFNMTAVESLYKQTYDHNEPKLFHNSARNESLGIDYTELTDVHKAYRLYLDDRWYLDKKRPTWNNKEVRDA